MIKVEDIQSYGKEHLETVVASATTVQNGLQAIASAYGDYTKKSFEDTKSFVEKLSGVKSLDKAIEVQTEFAKSAYETYVAEAQKIAGLYTDLAKQASRSSPRPQPTNCGAGKTKSPAIAAGLFLFSDWQALPRDAPVTSACGVERFEICGTGSICLDRGGQSLKPLPAGSFVLSNPTGLINLQQDRRGRNQPAAGRVGPNICARLRRAKTGPILQIDRSS